MQGLPQERPRLQGFCFPMKSILTIVHLPVVTGTSGLLQLMSHPSQTHSTSHCGNAERTTCHPRTSGVQPQRCEDESRTLSLHQDTRHQSVNAVRGNNHCLCRVTGHVEIPLKTTIREDIAIVSQKQQQSLTHFVG
jgi:hypothetical protein